MSIIEKDRELRAEFEKIGKKAAYGTAGFRDLAVNMPYVINMTLRSLLELGHWLLSSIKHLPSVIWAS